MKEYPRDILPLYAQGHSLASFLMSQGGKQKFLNYLAEGMEDDELGRRHGPPLRLRSLGVLQTPGSIGCDAAVRRSDPTARQEPDRGQGRQASAARAELDCPRTVPIRNRQPSCRSSEWPNAPAPGPCRRKLRRPTMPRHRTTRLHRRRNETGTRPAIVRLAWHRAEHATPHPGDQASSRRSLRRKGSSGPRRTILEWTRPDVKQSSAGGSRPGRRTVFLFAAYAERVDLRHRDGRSGRGSAVMKRPSPRVSQPRRGEIV